MADNGHVHVIDSKESWAAKLEDGAKHNKTIVVDFTATWCGPCRIMSPIFTELSKKHENIVFLKVDVDEFQEIASEWEVRAMPTFLFIKDQKIVEKIVGANKDELESKVRSFAEETQNATGHGQHAPTKITVIMCK
ncbi:hypothetical protein Mapa_006859 [Marchantia paleacea]|nr:hypothetical protein Mapa_006859 [Marchantia paleacea]